ncbi:Hemoglobin subunit beta-1 [Bagarius yarrelli]|uniref:Hemoglobin subunit beta-1 n=1 Tax=Bagarius yarrelli TaxID=175774 RepID=A0A556V8M3_BAGYA|nr:Hemoglobin subunit beta-1 [Bagarius yarrelli]
MRTFRNSKSHQHGRVDRLRALYPPEPPFQDRLRVCRSTGAGELLADIITIVVASVLGASFTAEVQAVLQKFLSVVVSALGKQYH